MREHFLPKRPVVLLPAPDVQPVVDAFLVEQVRKVLVGIQANIPFRGAQDDVHLPERRMVVARKEIYRVVKIDIIVVITIHKHFYVKGAAHGEHVADQFRVLKSEIGRMVAAKTRTCNGYLAPCCIPPDARHQLVKEHLIIPDMVPDPVCRMDTLVVPAQCVHAVGAENLNKAPLHVPVRGLYQTEVLALVIPALTGREQDHRIALMPVDEHFDLPAKALGVPLVISLSHVFRLDAAPKGRVIVLLTISSAKIRAFPVFQSFKLLMFKCLSGSRAIVECLILRIRINRWYFLCACGADVKINP